MDGLYVFVGVYYLAACIFSVLTKSLYEDKRWRKNSDDVKEFSFGIRCAVQELKKRSEGSAEGKGVDMMAVNEKHRIAR